MSSKEESCFLGLDCWIGVSLVLKGEVLYDVDEGLVEELGDESRVVLSSSDLRLFYRKFF